VERYGKLIQDESERLSALVEQVLRYGSMKGGHMIGGREPVAIEDLIEDSLPSSEAAVHGASLLIERQVEPGLPLMLADGVAMRHALQNLLDNAVKYGTSDTRWIGIFAAAAKDREKPAVEIRIADRGPGIP